MNDSAPPVTKYRLTLTIKGNTHDEIADELHMAANGGFLLSSDYGTRDSFESTGGRDHMVLEMVNPSMTPDQYAGDLSAWFDTHTRARTEGDPA